MSFMKNHLYDLEHNPLTHEIARAIDLNLTTEEQFNLASDFCNFHGLNISEFIDKYRDVDSDLLLYDIPISIVELFEADSTERTGVKEIDIILDEYSKAD